ncbi:hypothetical protein GCM10025868_19370 [Angustibacter aerolatus]|uniref:Uncharacterized protein n=1 Tax=Angustibacter aerolatus TaxID=1162965 RepID=A0ABQ6JIK6_9ACTN|nr:hypothetical protein GCM10025868_19370 [Angustibacter aerolatus]
MPGARTAAGSKEPSGRMSQKAAVTKSSIAAPSPSAWVLTAPGPCSVRERPSGTGARCRASAGSVRDVMLSANARSTLQARLVQRDGCGGEGPEGREDGG